jgi:hypothetical protein
MKVEIDVGSPSGKLIISSLALRKASEYLDDKTILAFYSCCKNKPHRF